ncbi:MAG TPA: glycosyltransferase, partial [Acidimicrobiales bacterium]
MTSLRVLLASTPVGPLGSGIGGGVELTASGIERGLTDRGHRVTVVAPEGSRSTTSRLVQVPGTLVAPAQTLDRTTRSNLPADSVLVRMWDEIADRERDFDVVVNLAYDVVPFERSAVLSVPVAHLVSMASLTDEMDEAVVRMAHSRPGSVAMHSRAQVATFEGLRDEGPVSPVRVIGSGLDLSHYGFVAHPEARLAWVGRISPEKGLGDAIAVAEATGLPLRVWGLMEHPEVWDAAVAAYPDASVHHEGFLSTAELQAGLGPSLALLVTPHWVEAFGNVVIEALACGVPVITYAGGGP